MSSVNPRASGLWSSSRMSYVSLAESYDEGGEDVDIEGMGFDNSDELDGRTPLDRTIDRIGMGSYQWTLLCLCGFAIAIILPRVQQHFSVPDSYIGTLSSSMFAGMMFGAVGWGTCSDLMGRTTAFNATLFLTSLFGIFASLAGTFAWLCVALFFLGSAVGGSMPTDGTLLLEHMPNGKKYLVTALSVFFSFGAVLAAVIGLVVIPSHSCPPPPATCDVASQNVGWKYLMIALGLITLIMFIARMVFFRLHESPRYLVHAGRPQEAIESLQLISKFNGSELSLDLEDIEDIVRSPVQEATSSTNLNQPLVQSGTIPVPVTRQGNESPLPNAAHYSSVGEPDVALASHSFGTPLPFTSQPFAPEPRRPLTPRSEDGHAADIARPIPRQRMPSSSGQSSRRMSRRVSTASTDGAVPEWLNTTLLVWAAWCAMSLAYTMFNVYLPKLLETRSSSNDPAGPPKSLEDSLWDVVIYSVGGCPGAILGAWLIESPLGRRWSLAGSTFVTAFFCWVFAVVEHPWAVRASTVGISLSATAMWAVLYGWTPEIFGTKVRGTACGIASALSRIGGMIAPILGGFLLMIDRSFPVYASIVIFIIGGVCVLFLHEREATERGGARVLAH
ncbi:MFS general substrate transporter [Daedaleopsis nitida]|nr:MFS general substrate transporter [Daedaleopsis nitida]